MTTLIAPEKNAGLSLVEAILVIAERTGFQTDAERDQVLAAVRRTIDAEQAMINEFAAPPLVLDGGGE